MLNSIFHAGTFSYSAVITAITVALILGIFTAVTYMLTGNYNKQFVVILSVLPMLIMTVIMIVNGNLGASVAVLGAFGLVRFRSAPGPARDIGYIFLTMVIGLSVGMGFLSLAVLITIVAGLLLVLLTKSPFGNDKVKERELKITIPEDLDYTGIFDDLFQLYTSECKLVRVKTTNMGTMYELVYHVCLRDPQKAKQMIDELRCRNGNLTIILGLVQYEKVML